MLYAKQVNITVYIWKKENDTDLSLYGYHEAGPSAQNEIHMLFTNSFTHFNLLSKPSIQEVTDYSIDSLNQLENEEDIHTLTYTLSGFKL